MTNWRAVAIGVLALVASAAYFLADESPGILLVGVVAGLATGYAAPGGVRSGTWHGLVVGVVALLAMVGIVVSLVTVFQPEYVAPGFGASLMVLLLVGVGYLVEAVVSSAFVGLLTR